MMQPLILTMLGLCLVSCSAPPRHAQNRIEEAAMQGQTEIMPEKWRDDALKTLGIASSEEPVSWSRLERDSKKRGYRPYRDRFEESNIVHIMVGWNDTNTVFRSYKLTLNGDNVDKIEAKYSYKAL